MSSGIAIRRRNVLIAAGATLAAGLLDGATAAAQAQAPDNASNVGPAIAEFNGKLYAVWKDAGTDAGLYFASFDGSKWSAAARIPRAATSAGPSLAAFGNKLYAAWKGRNTDQRLWYATFDGMNWSPHAQIPGAASTGGPSLTTFGGKLFAAWKDVSGGQLRDASFDGSAWSAQPTLPGNSGQRLPQNIGLRMQYQQTSEWCWIAIAVSIDHFYNPASTSTQCSVMTAIGQAINKWPSTTLCCPNAAALASDPGLASALAEPIPHPHTMCSASIKPT